MRTFRKEAAMIVTLGLALQGCMVTTPDHTFCSGHNNLQTSPSSAASPLARSAIMPLPPQLPASPVPPVIRENPTPGAIQPGVSNFLLNNVTQLLLVCAVSGNCR
ncbi:MAG: Unknown protein [uncultured Thiotrichaceae bacterium]|uniref:Lipoprotein n=1 Tax=uncultured Thiotrichaceae bacterium TaxID=298394 RepID=A0A6S6TZ78_9GAMM|nr:MAG: Unknown protein [uncultured Thiotrichaceae bacterium]